MFIATKSEIIRSVGPYLSELQIKKKIFWASWAEVKIELSWAGLFSSNIGLSWAGFFQKIELSWADNFLNWSSWAELTIFWAALAELSWAELRELILIGKSMEIQKKNRSIKTELS